MPEIDPNEADQHDDDTVVDEGPAVEELESDPAYNPQDEDLKDLKGG
jgi:hypothetical protein